MKFVDLDAPEGGAQTVATRSPAAAPPHAATPPRSSVRRREELLRGLLSPRPFIAPKFLYDALGAELYEQICRLDEYYPPRLEAALMERHAARIARELPRHAQFVDLGCGDGLKAKRWLRAADVSRYVGVDIAPAWLASTLQRGRHEYPDIEFHGVVTDFSASLCLLTVLSDPRPRIFFYPGSSIGNFEPSDALRLLQEIRGHMDHGDRLLIGVDAPKDEATLIAAYDDRLGVTAAFNLNVLSVVNRELGADFDPAWFSHRAVYDASTNRIEMHLVSITTHTVRLGALDHRRFEAGEAIVTEHSYKYSPPSFDRLLRDAGFGHVTSFTTPNEEYGIYLAGVTIEQP